MKIFKLKWVHNSLYKIELLKYYAAILKALYKKAKALCINAKILYKNAKIRCVSRADPRGPFLPPVRAAKQKGTEH